MGFYVREGPDGESIVETFTCCHCQVLVHLGDTESGRLQHASRAGKHVSTTRENVHMCHRCWKRVCNACHADGRCRPWEKQCEAFERRVNAQLARGVTRRSMGIE